MLCIRLKFYLIYNRYVENDWIPLNEYWTKGTVYHKQRVIYQFYLFPEDDRKCYEGLTVAEQHWCWPNTPVTVTTPRELVEDWRCCWWSWASSGWFLQLVSVGCAWSLPKVSKQFILLQYFLLHSRWWGWVTSWWLTVSAVLQSLIKLGWQELR